MEVRLLLMERHMQLLEILVLVKSTLASAFLKKGYKLLSDDVIAVSLSQEESIPLCNSVLSTTKAMAGKPKYFGMEIQ